MTGLSKAASLALFGIAAIASPGAQAQGVVTVQKLSAGLANELVAESVAECAKKNYAVTAVVVDLDGQRQAMLRGNGAPIHSSDNAFYKAYASASLTLSRKEDSTKAVAERQRTQRPPCRRPRCPMSPTRSAASRSRSATTSLAVSVSAALPAASSTRNAAALRSPRSPTE
jgi:hypothetical protein